MANFDSLVGKFDSQSWQFDSQSWGVRIFLWCTGRGV